MRVVEGVVRLGEDGGAAAEAGAADEDAEAGAADGAARGGAVDAGVEAGTAGTATAEGRADGAPRFPDVDSFVAELGRIGDEHGVAVQAFDARLVVDRAHLDSAVAHAARSFERGENVADDLAVEILLYAAGRRQIDRALAMGVDEGETPTVVVVDGTAPGGSGPGESGDSEPDDPGDSGPGDPSEVDPARADAVAAVRDLLEPADTLGVATDEEAVRAFFEVSQAELAATDADLSALVRERVALLDVEK